MQSGHTWTQKDFEELSWHDCHVWGLEIRAGDSSQGDWTCELVLHLDYICEWQCGTNRHYRFWVAPARLVFQNAEDLLIAIDWKERQGGHLMIYEPALDGIERENIPPTSNRPGNNTFRYTLRTNSPDGGLISVTTDGFTQTLLAAPELIDQQSFSWTRRKEILKQIGWPGV